MPSAQANCVHGRVSPLARQPPRPATTVERFGIGAINDRVVCRISAQTVCSNCITSICCCPGMGGGVLRRACHRSVCLCPRAYPRNCTFDRHHVLPVAMARTSHLLWRRCDALCRPTSSFANDVIFAHNMPL